MRQAMPGRELAACPPRRGRSSAAPRPSRRAPGAPRPRAAPSPGERSEWGRSSTASSTASTAPCARSVGPSSREQLARGAPRSPAAVRARSASSGSSVRLEPARRPRPDASHLGRGRAALGRARTRAPASRASTSRPSCPWSSTKRPRRASGAERLGGAATPERLAERGSEALERRHRPHQRLDLRRLVREDLGGEVGEQRAARPADALERRLPLGGRHPAERLDREPHRRGPAAGRLAGGRTAVSASAAPASEARSVAVSSASNASSAPASSSTWPWPRRRSIGNGSSAREASTRWSRGGAWRQSDSITCTAPTEPATAWTSSTTSTRSRRSAVWRVSQSAAANPRARRGLVLLRARAGRGRHRAGRVDRECRDAQPERVGEPPGEARERRVVRGGRVPGAVDLPRPVGEQRRLAEPGPGDDRRQPTAERLREDARAAARAGAAASARPGGRSRVVDVAGVRERAAGADVVLRPR